MVFIDALGTNNTAYLAENEEKLAQYKKECVNELSGIIGSNLDKYLESKLCQVELNIQALKAGLFSIARLPNEKWDDPFNLHAPTTSANAMKVINSIRCSVVHLLFFIL